MIEKDRLHSHRREYNKTTLDEKLMPKNPLEAFHEWLNKALELIHEDATAMVLSTSSPLGQPSSRIVLLKQADREGFVFFTNYQSRKGQELEQNQRASLLFYWKELERQIRIEGNVKKTSSGDSNAYFSSRPIESQITAIVSKQSAQIRERSELETSFKAFQKKNANKKLSRPDYWGGYVLSPNYFEFWQGRPNRMHDRIIYKKDKNKWVKERLSP